MRAASLMAVVILLGVAAAHLLRLVLRVEVLVGGVELPMWISLGGCVIPGIVALLLWRERGNHRPAPGGRRDKWPGQP